MQDKATVGDGPFVLGRFRGIPRGTHLLWRRHHQPRGDLAERVGTQANGDELQQLCLHLGVEIDQLEVAAAQTTLAKKALYAHVTEWW